MRQISSISLLLASLTVLCACASEGPAKGAGDPDVAEVTRTLDCDPGHYAVCVDTSCEPEEYVCAPRGAFRGIYEPRIKY